MVSAVRTFSIIAETRTNLPVRIVFGIESLDLDDVPFVLAPRVAEGYLEKGEENP